MRREMLAAAGLSRGAVKPRQPTFQSLLGTRKKTLGTTREVNDQLSRIRKAQRGVLGKWADSLLVKVFGSRGKRRKVPARARRRRAA